MNFARYAVVTGCNRGIGRATAQTFAEAGYVVFGLDISDDPPPSQAIFVKADVSSSQAVSEAFNKIREHTDRLEALINNAGICPNASLIDTTPDQWDRVMAVNLGSVYLVTREAYPLLLRGKSPAIVNVSSVHAVGTSRGVAAYAASKGAVTALTRAMALEMADDRIRVNCVLPGAVDTPMLHEGFLRGHFTETVLEQQKEQLAHRTPLKKIGRPEEIAKAILFLASSETAAFITGQTLIVDGGALAQLGTEQACQLGTKGV